MDEEIQEIFLTNSGHENADTLVGQRLTSRWLSGEFPYIAKENISGLRKKFPLTLPDGEILLQLQSPKTITILQEANDKSWILSVSLRRDYDAVYFQVAARDPELARKLVASLCKGIRRKEVEDPNKIRVKFWYHSADGPQCSSRTITIRPWKEISSNYVEFLQKPISYIMNITPEKIRGRIIIMHGPPGSGKTTLLRALGGAWRNWCDVSYILDPDRMLNDGTYMMEALLDDDEPDRWRLIILEDSGPLFAADAKKDVGQAALSRLLNMTDGILGQGRNIIFALTTNEPYKALHPAMMRPGRAIAALEIPVFPIDEATKWLGRPAGDKELTLVELLARRDPQEISVITASTSKKYSTGQYL